MTCLKEKNYYKSLMVEWLGLVSQGHDMYCHDLEVKVSKPDRA